MGTLRSFCALSSLSMLSLTHHVLAGYADRSPGTVRCGGGEPGGDLTPVGSAVDGFAHKRRVGPEQFERQPQLPGFQAIDYGAAPWNRASARRFLSRKGD